MEMTTDNEICRMDAVAVIAAMRKLLSAVWSVATHRRPFIPHLPVVPVQLGAVTNKV